MLSLIQRFQAVSANCKSPLPALIACSLVFILPLNLKAEILVTDDSGVRVQLQQPAERIISLAPNLTELLFAAGAGDKIIASVRHSDYPEAAKNIPVIGDAHNLDMEALMLLAPDLVLLWESGTGEAIRQKLVELGLTVFHSEPDSLEKIASTIQRLGQLAGTEDIAEANSRQFSRTITALRQQYSSRKPISVFYQFWNRPIFTVNGRHLISRVIELCGGTNVFSELPALTPQISTEAALTADPDVIITSGEDETPPDWMDDWHRWPELTAISDSHLYFIPPDIILRHTPRIAEGAAMMCGFIDRARQ